MIPDLLVLSFFIITLLTYDYSLHPEPEKLLFGGQLVVLWFLLRVLLKEYPSLRLFFLAFILLTAGIEAFRGLEQLYGYRTSSHHLFRLTGSFYNPGPYSGYLAIVLPVALGFMLRIGKQKRHSWWHYTTVLYAVSWSVFVLILLVLPAGMSRSAWLAGGIACGWILKGELKKLSPLLWRGVRGEVCPPFRGLGGRLGGRLLLLCLFVVLLGGLYMMKKDSANGRLLMWKVTAQGIIHQPVTGTGLGGFPAAYAGEQADYFASGDASQTEKLVAGCPEYAFNEYLQIGLEQGIAGLVCFVLWLIYSFYYGVKNRRFGAAGGILAFTVFAFSSYPLQLPSFWVLLLILSAVCVAEPCSSAPYKQLKIKANSLLICIVGAALSILFCHLQQRYYPAYQEWNTLVVLYNNKAYGVASPKYKKLYPHLNHRPEYLFEYAQCLAKTGHYTGSNALFERASRLSSDPMILYMMAKNSQELGTYQEAEKLLLHGIDILPERIYPYYLLSKLYGEPAFYNPIKLQAAIDSVLTKEPKVQTTAILEMREEVKKLKQMGQTQP